MILELFSRYGLSEFFSVKVGGRSLKYFESFFKIFMNDLKMFLSYLFKEDDRLYEGMATELRVSRKPHWYR